MLLRLAFINLVLSFVKGCTTIGVGKNATVDGSTMTTHNADCLDCDFRIGKVPRRSFPPGSYRNVIKYRPQYPRVVTEDRGTTWSSENLEGTQFQLDTWKSNEWMDSQIIGQIPEVNMTFASIEGIYGIINEKQVSIGESTCGALFFAGPVSENCSVCNALFDVSELTRIAMERASTAREAIEIMGNLAVDYGLYGSSTSFEDDPMVYSEAGEALIVSDPNEVWVFHILSDDTSKSAVWAAQRPPENHVTVVANQFIIRNIGVEDWENFMYSPNIFEVAKRSWADYQSGPLDFAKVFGAREFDWPHYAYSTRRVWRVFDIVAPNSKFSPYVDSLGNNLPFSVQPEHLMSPRDVIAILRDHYEGTEFDLTKGLAAGPFGDPDRYDIGSSFDMSISKNESLGSGFFERSISLFRASYTFVTQSRQNLPNEIGALVWLTQYKPTVSTFIPIYVAGDDVPYYLKRGSLFSYSEDSLYWAFSIVGNWLSKAHKYIFPSISPLRNDFEDKLFENQKIMEDTFVNYFTSGNETLGQNYIFNISNNATTSAFDECTKLFKSLVSKFHDGYILSSENDTTINIITTFYPRNWLEAVGFFESKTKDFAAVQIVDSVGEYNELALAEIELSNVQISIMAINNRSFSDYDQAKANYFLEAANFYGFELCNDVHTFNFNKSPCKCYKKAQKEDKNKCKIAYEKIKSYDKFLKNAWSDGYDLMGFNEDLKMGYQSFPYTAACIFSIGLICAALGVFIGKRLKTREIYAPVLG